MISSKGQITIPSEIRKKLNLKEGDKGLFLEENDRIIVMNSSMVALIETKQSLAAEAEKHDLNSSDDVNDMVKK